MCGTVLLALICWALFTAVLILLVDGRHPYFYMTDAQEITATFGEPYKEPGIRAVLRGRLFGEWKREVPVRVEGKVDTDTLGRYILTYSARFLFRKASCTRSVTVADRTAPLITLKSKPGYSPSWLEGYREEGFEAFDDVDGDVTDRVRREDCGAEVCYRVRDSAGNESTAVRIPKYSVQRPEIVLNGPDSLRIPASMYYEDPGVTAVDALGNDLSAYVETEGEVRPWEAGEYTLRYTVTNRLGDTVSAVRRVTVEDRSLPEPETPEQETIYLTFDDGPGPYTGRLLDLLDRYPDVKVTFFVTEAFPEYFDCIGRAYRAGHAVGVHTASHVYREIYESEEAFFRDFNRMQSVILEQTGSFTGICRFPGGSSNTVSGFNRGIMTRLAEDLHALGYQYFDWSVNSGDAEEAKNAAAVYYNVINRIGRQYGPVVLQHDIKAFSVEAVEDIIRWGQRNGYVFRALEPDSPPVQHGIVN